MLYNTPRHCDGEQLALSSLVNCSPIDCTRSSRAEQCESQCSFLSHLITQICFQLSRFSSGVLSTVWCWEIRFLPFGAGMTEGYYMFWVKYIIWSCLPQWQPPVPVSSNPIPNNGSNRCFFSSEIEMPRIWNHKTSYHSQTHFFLLTPLGMLHFVQSILKGDQARATYFRDKHNAKVWVLGICASA